MRRKDGEWRGMEGHRAINTASIPSRAASNSAGNGATPRTARLQSYNSVTPASAELISTHFVSSKRLFRKWRYCRKSSFISTLSMNVLRVIDFTYLNPSSVRSWLAFTSPVSVIKRRFASNSLWWFWHNQRPLLPLVAAINFAFGWRLELLILDTLQMCAPCIV